MDINNRDRFTKLQFPIVTLLSVILLLSGCSDGNGGQRSNTKITMPSTDSRFDADHAQAISGAIESVVFDYLPRGGQFGIVPVMLLEGGRACTDMGLLVNYKSADQHRAKHPLRWRQWRLDGGTVQLKGKGDWKKAQYQQRNFGFPDGYRLNRLYKRVNSISSGGGNYAMASAHYEFKDDGTFVSGRSAMANASNHLTGAQAGVGSIPEDESGRYHIDGYFLRLEFNSGKVIYKAIVTDDQDDPEVIWINGYDYVSD